MPNTDNITFLVASDVHLGYKEKDVIRGRDSFVAFDEVFKIANEKNVDFVLLGGDLFHENKPSRKTLHDCMEIMAKHCLGDRPGQVRVISDQVENFGHTSETVKSVNYENPNVNVSMPVFSIHGNHDDPAAGDRLSAIDLLSVPGLLNHFGKASSTESIRISPVILQKGNTKIALYGLGAIHDGRLNQLFTNNKVEFIRPEVDAEKCFNIMVIHQNRYERGQRKFIPEDFLDDFFDLVIWGHEHECITEPKLNVEKGFFVLQPGSTVATKLNPSEIKLKHAFVIDVCGRSMDIKPIPLRTSRILKIENVILKQTDICPTKLGVVDKMIAYCEKRVRFLVNEVKRERSDDLKRPEKPLIRLRINYSGGYPTFDRSSFGRKFRGMIANPDETVVRYLTPRSDEESSVFHRVFGEVANTRVEDLILEYLANDEQNQMTLFSAKGLEEAVNQYSKALEGSGRAKQQDGDAISIFCEGNLKKVCRHLKKKPSLNITEDSIAEEIEHFAKGFVHLENNGAPSTSLPAGQTGTQNGAWTSIRGDFSPSESGPSTSSAQLGGEPATTAQKTSPRKSSKRSRRTAGTSASGIFTKVAIPAATVQANISSFFGAMPRKPGSGGSSSTMRQLPLQEPKEEAQHGLLATSSDDAATLMTTCDEMNDDYSDDDVVFVSETLAKIIKLE